MRDKDSTGRRFTAEQVTSLIAVTEPWLSCDGCFDSLDECVDDLVDGADRIDEPLRVHLARCPACLEETETLLILAAEDQQADADDLVARLHALTGQEQSNDLSANRRRFARRRWRHT